MRRREFITLIGGLTIAWPLAFYAQQPIQPLKRVGFLALAVCPIPSDWVGTRHLAALGWVEGRNFVFDCVTAAGRWDIPALAHELVSRRPDVLVTSTTPFAMALKEETRTIPIVMISPSR
jgi:putative tryptophan/tyrosine transport system substrate-binding protein